MKRLEGKVATVTGSGGGIGKAIAFKLTVGRARVRINDFDAKAVEATTNEIRALAREDFACAGDVTLSTSVIVAWLRPWRHLARSTS
ncbi:SDR family NAD(P)-dependent oxidoreductase [Sphingorhabdus sp.]|jgi:3-oxoacyl-[acyl-carrier protein] reductase|uniref:SDR family NAD(P)-dependent oxidoreductase n=1 Tax=Sphingorhabdus sp. TaxID=1902408 RepID=UPI0037C9068A